MDVSRPYTAVVPSIDGDVLVALAGSTAPLTGRQVARLVPRGSQRGVTNALDRLVGQGIVDRQETGSAYLHTLNRTHLAAPAVELLANLRNELIIRLRELFASWQLPPVHASMFGSAARGDGARGSDIDLLIVRANTTDPEDDAWRSQLGDLAVAVRAWTGNHASIMELGEAEFRELPEHPQPIVDQLATDGIDLAGEGIRRALRAVT